MNLFYKRVKWWPNNADLTKLDFIRSLFEVNLDKSLNEETLIINLDQ